MNDQELVEGCLKENIIFQEKLYRKYCSKMMGISMRYVKSREEAEDVVQEGFIKVFDHLKTFRFDCPLEGWISRIMVNTAITFYNRNKKISMQEDIDSIHEDLNPYAETISQQLQAKDLLKLINQLPEGYKMVFNLFAIEGYGHKEIGEMLGISESTSKTQYMKARNFLKKLLEQNHLALYE